MNATMIARTKITPKMVRAVLATECRCLMEKEIKIKK